MTKIMHIRQQMCSRLPQEMLVTHSLRHVQIAPKLVVFLADLWKYCWMARLSSTFVLGLIVILILNHFETSDF